MDCISSSNILQFKIDEIWYDKQYALDKKLIIPNDSNTNYDVPHSAVEKLWDIICYNNFIISRISHLIEPFILMWIKSSMRWDIHMHNYMKLEIPDCCICLTPGCKVKLGRFDSDIWVVGYGWYEWGGNRPVCGWYLTNARSPEIKPLQRPDLDDIYIIEY